MGLLQRIGLRESSSTQVVENGVAYSVEFLKERLAELELQLEDAGWTKLNFENEMEFSRAGLQRICALSRLFFLKNPLINRAVTLQSMYVWGQGVSIRAANPAVDAIVQAFLDDSYNQVELTSHQARTMKEQDLEVEGNLFFAFFSHVGTGRTRVSTIPTDEIDDIICNPENRKEPWYYKRTRPTATLDAALGSAVAQTAGVVYHPDWRYKPQVKPPAFGGAEVLWDQPVYHVRVGGLSTMRFGLPETYQGIDWARAYKEFLEDWATIVRAYAKFAWKKTNSKGGKAGIAAVKAKLGSTLGLGSGETNPPPGVGSMAVMPSGDDLQPIRTAGATTSAEDGRRLLLMVAAATGLPETFFGDASVGSLATAKSLDRPTELKFVDRQELWKSVLNAILQYVIERRALAPGYGGLHGVLTWNDEHDKLEVTLEVDPEAVDENGIPTGEPIDRHVDIDFPDILAHETKDEIAAIISAATLDGKATAGTIDPKTVSRLLLTALGQDDVDDLLGDLFPDEDQGAQVAAKAEQTFVQAVAEMREALRGLSK
jgi:hypothetical protein